MIRFLCLGAFLTGCAHSTQLKSRDIEGIKDGASSAIILDLKLENIGCQLTRITLRDINTANTIAMEHSASWKKGSLPFAVKAVPAGDYAFQDGNCETSYRSGDYQYTDTHQFSLFGPAFTPIKVEAGEVIYPGTLHLRKDENDLVSYGLLDEATDVEIALQKYDSDLAGAFKKHLIKTAPNQIAAPIMTQTRYHYVAPVKPYAPKTPPNKK